MEINLKLTEGLAIYAACLSTIVFFWNVVKGTPRYKVDLVFGSTEEDGECKFGIYVSVKNPSTHTIHLSNISLLYPYRSESVFDKIAHLFKYRTMSNTVGWVHTSLSNFKLDDKCPIALEPGQSHEVFVPEEVIEKVLSDSTKRKLRAVVQDQLWRNKYSSKFDYPKNEK